jgi:hypothetical protein
MVRIGDVDVYPVRVVEYSGVDFIEPGLPDGYEPGWRCYTMRTRWWRSGGTKAWYAEHYQDGVKTIDTWRHEPDPCEATTAPEVLEDE